MSTEHLTGTQKTSIDLVALRAWHWKASMDAERQPEMRRWHRQQVKHITLRLSQRTGRFEGVEVQAMIEMSTEQTVEELYHNVAKAYAGDWQKLCDLTREAIIRKMEPHPPWDKLE